MKAKTYIFQGMLMLAAVSCHAVNFARLSGSPDWSSLPHWLENSSGSYEPAANFPTASDTLVLNGGKVLRVDMNAVARTVVLPNAASDAVLELSVPGTTLTADWLLVGNPTQAGNGIVNHSTGTLSVMTVDMRPTENKSGTYTLSGGLLTATSLNIGVATAGATGHSWFVQSGGAVSASNLNIGGAGSGRLELSGGTLDTANTVNLYSNGCLAVEGAGASINLGGLAPQTGAVFEFQLKGGGVSAIQAGGSVDLSGTSLLVDGSAYGGAPTNLVLLDAGSLLSMPASVTVSGLADATVTQVANSVVLEIVESQTSVLFDDAVGDGLWGTAGNWSTGVVPSGAVHAMVGDAQVATLSSNAPAVNAITVGSNGTLVIQAVLTTAVFAVEGQGTLKLDLEMTGFQPLSISDSVTFESAAQLIIDGTVYEGFDGYFPLIQSSNLPPGITNATFIGLDDREPALLIESDGLWLRLVAPPALSERLCSLVPESTVEPAWSNTQFSVTREYDPSGSAWSLTLDEAHVLDTTLSQVDSMNTNCSWELRTGRGGFIYSLRTPALGETVPPSYRSDGNSSPWNDEVWQGVAVSPLNNPPDSRYFMHQSGVYLRDPVLKKPFYSPQVASHLDEANRTFTTINWTPQAHIDIYADGNTSNDWKSYLLMFTRYRDLGQGVIEVSLGMYNYGPDHLNWFNMPWGGVRRTSTEYAFVSDPGGISWSEPVTDNWGTVVDFDTTGGWMGYSATTNGITPALGFVFGQDAESLLPHQIKKSWFRWGYAGGAFSTNETSWRNYFVTTGVRHYNLSQGMGIWSRSYFALGDDMQDLSDRIADRGLVNVELRAFEYTELTSPLVAYSVSGSGADFQCLENGTSPDFFLYAHPVSGSSPIFEIVEGNGTRYLTWNPYANGIVKPYDGTIAGMRLLGFAMPSAGTNGTYAVLDSLLPAQNYFADGKTLHVRTATSIETWRVEYFGFTHDAGEGANIANPDGDSAVNLWEYGLGGDPTNGVDVGHVPTFGNSAGGLDYVHARRIGSESELSYTLESTSNLLSNDWKTADSIQLPIPGTLDPDFEAVTNRIDTAGKTNEFIRLRIDAL